MSHEHYRRFRIVRSRSKITFQKSIVLLYCHYGKFGSDFQCPAEVSRPRSVPSREGRRRWAACEALALGRGGISVVVAATKLSHPTIRRGIAELQAGDDSSPGETQPDHPRIRRPGGGRDSIAATDRTLLRDLKRLIDPATRGDPMSPLLWTCKSTRNLVFLLTKLDLNSRCVFCKPLPHLVVRPRPLHGAGITMIVFWP